MKRLLLLKVSILLILLNICFSHSQESKSSTPLHAKDKINAFKIGEIVGVNNLLSPTELVDKPTLASATVENSLLNGLNGLGFAATYNFGISGKYFFSEKMDLGASVEYSGWDSENSCNCVEEIYKSDNSLSLLHLGIFSEYFFWNDLYVTGEIGINLFGVEVSENSKRGNIDFEENYTRIGLGLGLGYEIPLSNNFDLNISGKVGSPNLLKTSSDKSLIYSKIKSDEPTLLILSLNISLLYTL